jgi:SWI/SNF-related matrix-associated actin-dependent regulator of chromatin subfamily D
MNPGSKTLMKVPKRMFSSFFNKIFIQLDKNLFPDEDIIEWHRTPQTKETEGFEIKRIGNQGRNSQQSRLNSDFISKETTAKILLYLDHKPPVYKVSPELAKLIMPDNRARYEDTRARIVMAIWQYIKVIRFILFLLIKRFILSNSFNSIKNFN